MNPVFTLNYPEFLIANHLKNLFKKEDGYSILIPVSSQQKGYDLALMRRQGSESKVSTFQVKSSTIHCENIAGTKTESKKFVNIVWFQRFSVPPEADFFIFVGLYAPKPTSLKNTTNVWHPHILLFTNEEMNKSMNSFCQKNDIKKQDSFAFGFNNSEEAFLTRGHVKGEHPDYSKYLLTNPDRFKLISGMFPTKDA